MKRVIRKFLWVLKRVNITQHPSGRRKSKRVISSLNTNTDICAYITFISFGFIC